VEHTHGLVLGQERVTDGEGELGALWRLLQQVSLHGRTVTADAGLLQSGITRVVTQRDGFYLGVLKDNQREVKAAVEVWLQEQGLALAYEQRRQADTVTQETSRGRQEERSLWLVPAGDLHPYLAREWGWWNVQQVGILRRRQQRRPTQPWQVQEVIVITSLDAHAASAGRILDLLRCHWIIENRVHYVRDVSYGEDRLHARKTGQVLAWARNIAINLLRSKDFRYIPDGWRFASAHPRTVVRWLTE
jgi:predicted transposase YbfD/YdcC